MSFGVSSSGISISAPGSKVSSSGASFGSISVGYGTSLTPLSVVSNNVMSVNTTDEEELDYSSFGDDLNRFTAQAIDVFKLATACGILHFPRTSGVLSVFAKDLGFDGTVGKNETNAFYTDKTINSFVWALSKGFQEWGYESFLKHFGASDGLLDFNTYGLVPIAEGVSKPFLYVVSCWISGKEIDPTKIASTFAAGFTKSEVGMLLKSGSAALQKTLLKIDFKGLDRKGITKLFNKLKFDDILSTGLTKGQVFTYALDSMVTGIGIDYFGSLAANAATIVMTGCVTGEWPNGEDLVKQMKFGSTFLKSSTKMVFATAGEIFGGKPGKIVMTAVGAFVAELQVAVFTDEAGNIDEIACAWAGAAVLVGAIVGVAVVVFAPFIAVSAAAIAAGMLIGATIGFAVVAIAAHAEEIYTEVKELVTEAVEVIEEFVEDVKQAVKANPVTNFLVGWAL